MSDFIILTKANTSDRNRTKFLVNLDYVIKIEPYTGKQIEDKSARTRLIMAYPDQKQSGKQEIYYVEESYDDIEKMVASEADHRS